MAKKCLITGGNGFIGKELAQFLANKGWEVVLLDLFFDKKDLHPKIVLLEGNLEDPEIIKKGLAGCSLVCHLAAINTSKKNPLLQSLDFDKNVLTTTNLLKAMVLEGVSKLIFASSQLVYGKHFISEVSENSAPLLPTSLYGASKLACEGLISVFCNEYNIDAVICRLGNIIGAQMNRGIIHDFFKRLQTDFDKFYMLGNGLQKRNYLLVDECVEAFFLLIEELLVKHPFFEIFNVGNSDTISARLIAEMAIEEMGLKEKTKIFFKPDPLGSKNDVPFLQLDINKMKQLGWTPKFASQEAVRRVVQQLINKSCI